MVVWVLTPIDKRHKWLDENLPSATSISLTKTIEKERFAYPLAAFCSHIMWLITYKTHFRRHRVVLISCFFHIFILLSSVFFTANLRLGYIGWHFLPYYIYLDFCILLLFKMVHITPYDYMNTLISELLVHIQGCWKSISITFSQ